MKAYKGFNKDMTCRGFQYEEGKEYQEDNAKLCESGFHACKNPIDCLAYYAPRRSVYHEVELDDLSDEVSEDSKICGKRIKIGARLSFVELAKRAVEYVKQLHGKASVSENMHSVNTSAGKYAVNTSRCNCSVNASAGKYSVNTSAGYCSVNVSESSHSVNTSECNHSVNTSTDTYSVNASAGYWSVNAAVGNWSVNTSKDNWSANTSMSDCSVNTSEGNWSVNTSVGGCSANTSAGCCSVNVSIGVDSRNKASAGSISVGWGKNNVCKGDIGSYMVLVERGYNRDEKKYSQIGEPVLVKVDGEKVKADTWYKLMNGELVEIEIMEDE